MTVVFVRRYSSRTPAPLTADAAFGLLSRASQRADIKLHDVRVGVCATGGLGDLRDQ